MAITKLGEKIFPTNDINSILQTEVHSTHNIKRALNISSLTSHPDFCMFLLPDSVESRVSTNDVEAKTISKIKMIKSNIQYEISP